MEAKEVYTKNEVDGLLLHIKRGINKHAPIANEYFQTILDRHNIKEGVVVEDPLR